MKSFPASFYRLILSTIPIVLVVLGLNCSLPDYPSPDPGILEIHLRSVSNNIPFTPLNNFLVTVSEVKADRDDGAALVVYQDYKAIDRKAASFNTLDFTARDSSMVLGQSYAPPGNYTGIEILIDPGSKVIEDGYRVIPVSTDPGFNSLLSFHGSYIVRENQTTVITLTIDLDKSLQKGADNFYFRPLYFVSSVR